MFLSSLWSHRIQWNLENEYGGEDNSGLEIRGARTGGAPLSFVSITASVTAATWMGYAKEREDTQDWVSGKVKDELAHPDLGADHPGGVPNHPAMGELLTEPGSSC